MTFIGNVQPRVTFIGNEQLSAEDHAGRLKQRRRLRRAGVGEREEAATGADMINNQRRNWRRCNRGALSRFSPLILASLWTNQPNKQFFFFKTFEHHGGIREAYGAGAAPRFPDTLASSQ